MTSVLLAAVYALGVAVAAALWPRRDPLLVAAIAFPIGLAAAVASVLALIFVGAPVTAATLAPVWIGGGLIAAAVAVRRGRAPDAWVIAGLAAAAIAGAIGATWLDRVSPQLVDVARQAREHDLVLDTLWRRLSRIGAFPLVVRTLLPAAAVMLAASAVALAVLVGRRTGAWLLAIALLVASVAITAAVARPVLGAAHVAAAAYLYAFVALWWLAVRDDAAPALALICLGALALQSTVTPFVAAPALVLALIADRTVREDAVGGAAALVVALIAWWSLVVEAVPYPGLAAAAIAAMAAALALGLLLSRDVDASMLEPLGGRARAIALAFVAALVVTAAGNARRMTENQRRLPDRWRIAPHDTFDVEAATRGMRARSIDLLERAP